MKRLGEGLGVLGFNVDFAKRKLNGGRGPFEQFLYLLATERWGVLMSKEDGGWFYQWVPNTCIRGDDVLFPIYG